MFRKYLALMFIVTGCGRCSIADTKSYYYDVSKVPKLCTIPEVENWIKTNIKYQEDKETFGMDNVWQSPNEVVENGAGDCFDCTCLYMYLLKLNFHLESEMKIVRILNPGYGGLHAYAEYDDITFDMLSWKKDLIYKHILTASYNDVMYTAQYLK